MSKTELDKQRRTKDRLNKEVRKGVTGPKSDPAGKPGSAKSPVYKTSSFKQVKPKKNN